MRKLSDLTLRKSHWFAENLPSDISIHGFRVLSFIALALQRFDFVISEHDPVGDTWQIDITSHDFEVINHLKTLQAKESMRKAYDELHHRQDWFLSYECIETHNTLRYRVALTPQFSEHFASLSECFTSYNPIHTVGFDLVTLRLYEFIIRWRRMGVVKPHRLDDVKAYVGITDKSSYFSTGMFMQRLRRSIMTINKFSDIEVELHEVKSGRAVLGVGFYISVRDFKDTYAFKNLDQVLDTGGFSFFPEKKRVGSKRVFEVQDSSQGKTSPSPSPKASVVESLDIKKSIKQSKGNSTCNNKTKTKTTPATNEQKNNETHALDDTDTVKNSTKENDEIGHQALNSLMMDSMAVYDNLKPCNLSLTAKERFLNKFSPIEIKQSIIVANRYIDKQQDEGREITNLAGLYNKAITQNWGKSHAEQQNLAKTYEIAKVEHEDEIYEKRWQASLRDMELQRQASLAEKQRLDDLKKLEDANSQIAIDFVNNLTDEQKDLFFAQVCEQAKGIGGFLRKSLVLDPMAFTSPMYLAPVMQTIKLWSSDQ